MPNAAPVGLPEGEPLLLHRPWNQHIAVVADHAVVTLTPTRMTTLLKSLSREQFLSLLAHWWQRALPDFVSAVTLYTLQTPSDALQPEQMPNGASNVTVSPRSRTSRGRSSPMRTSLRRATSARGVPRPSTNIFGTQQAMVKSPGDGSDTNDSEAPNYVSPVSKEEWFELCTLQKGKLIEIMSIRIFAQQLTHLQVAQIHTEALLSGVSRRTWDVYHMHTPDTNSFQSIVDKVSLTAALVSQLTPAYPCHVYSVSFNQAILTRLLIYDGFVQVSLPKPTWIYYILYRPHTPFVAVTRGERALQSPVLQWIARLFGGTSLERHGLSSKDIYAISNLLLQRDAPGSFAMYREKDYGAQGPLAHRSKRPKVTTLLADPSKGAAHPSNAVRTQDSTLLREQQLQALRQFGPDTSRNLLDYLEVQHTSEYNHNTVRNAELGTVTDHLESLIIPMKITFHGSDLIAGFKSLITSGLTTGALPSFIADSLADVTNNLQVDTASISDKSR
ncbi:hypothetical protein IWQ61_006936 [Dispira simplex]|nr:hypothetical protein IWQ61_006936 [Dispira simplex]